MRVILILLVLGSSFRMLRQDEQATIIDKSEMYLILVFFLTIPLTNRRGFDKENVSPKEVL